MGCSHVLLAFLADSRGRFVGGCGGTVDEAAVRGAVGASEEVTGWQLVVLPEREVVRAAV